jgi:hypothetical protein
LFASIETAVPLPWIEKPDPLVYLNMGSVPHGVEVGRNLDAVQFGVQQLGLVEASRKVHE